MTSLRIALVAWMACWMGTEVAAARTAPTQEDGRIGSAYELDRRSHPVLNGLWDAFLEGTSVTGDLPSGLESLAGARILHREQDWVLVWLGDDASRDLRDKGVRLSQPRPRPPRQPRLAREGLPGGLLADPAVLGSLADAVSQDGMMEDLESISTDIQTRYYNTTGMQAATQFVFDRFTAYGLDDVYFDTFTYNGYTIRNVIGVKNGSLYPTRRYMICGHLDCTSGQPQTLAPGAEDNGSGSVAVLEAARLLAPLETESTVLFVCFTAEEQGLVGSYHLAQIADQQNWDLRGVLNMDMVGYDQAGAPDLWIEGFPGNPASVTLMDALETTANTYTDMAVYRYPNNGWGSDHVPWNDYGFASLLAIDYDWDSYGCYHQTCDVTANIVPSHLRRMTVAVLLTGAQLAGVDAELGAVAGIADKTDAADDSGVRIRLAGTAYDEEVSVEDGSFAMPDLLPGTYRIVASAAGYETAEQLVTVIGGESTPVTLHLDPLESSIVEGLVTADLGGSTAGSVVFAEGQDPVAVVQANGTYRLEPVLPGRVVLNVNKQGRMPAVRAVDIPSGEQIGGVDFLLKSNWNFEASNDGLTANTGWAWGTDQQCGAHSGSKIWETRPDVNYDNCADYRLDLPGLDLRFYRTARLRFWHWYRTESGHDGGNVQVSTDGGTSWTVVAPEDGYPGTLSGGCNVLAGQPGYTGLQTSWQQDAVDLGAYAGRAIQVRFWFGSDGTTRDRGWALDDLFLEGDLETTGLPVPDVASREGIAVTPNPSSGAVRIEFSMKADAPAWVTVFDTGGRRVRSLVEEVLLPTGTQSVSWDGRDDSGRAVASGTYWARVVSGGRSAFARFVLLAGR